jgi:hypothetical protein
VPGRNLFVLSVNRSGRILDTESLVVELDDVERDASNQTYQIGSPKDAIIAVNTSVVREDINDDIYDRSTPLYAVILIAVAVILSAIIAYRWFRGKVPIS